MMTHELEARLNSIEEFMGGVPGTTLSRVLVYNKGIEWCLAVGKLSQPKFFFYGSTIEQCINQAEQWMNRSTPTNLNPEGELLRRTEIIVKWA